MERILIICEEPRPLSPSAHAVLVANSLSQRGWPVCLVQLEKAKRKWQQAPALFGQGILADEHHIQVWHHRVDPTALRNVRAIARAFAPSRVHAWGPAAAQAAAAICATHDCPFVISHHDCDAGGRMTHLISGRAAAHLYCDPPSAQRAAERHKNWRNILTVPHGWPDFHEGDPWCADDVKRQLKIPLDARLIGVVAPLHPRSRLKDFVWACDLLSVIRDDFCFLIIGEGPLHWRLARFADQLDVKNTFQLLGWHPHAADIVRALDAYVQPSAPVSDGQGIMSAMQAGVPLILSSDHRHRHFLRHARGGYYVEPGARNEIARCVNRLLNEPKLAREMGRRGQARLSEKFPLAKTIDRICDIYGQLGGCADLRISVSQGAA